MLLSSRRFADLRSNAYYFWNAKTNTTTWDNPLETPVASTSAAPLPDEEAPPPLPPSGPDYGGIDPDLAYLDPSLSRSTAASSATPYFQARFNSRTGRFQGDPTMNPDRISEFKRGERQQEAYYDVSSWQSSLDGKGIKRRYISHIVSTPTLTASLRLWRGSRRIAEKEVNNERSRAVQAESYR